MNGKVLVKSKRDGSLHWLTKKAYNDVKSSYTLVNQTEESPNAQRTASEKAAEAAEVNETAKLIKEKSKPGRKKKVIQSQPEPEQS